MYQKKMRVAVFWRCVVYTQFGTFCCSACCFFFSFCTFKQRQEQSTLAVLCFLREHLFNERTNDRAGLHLGFSSWCRSSFFLESGWDSAFAVVSDFIFFFISF
ncbi:unnamed protein product [Amoebophrya sp. A120]|nr:unnamed protein product [Amoebophrya sp. A120]|eukprot:GSA120T00002810001.1